MRPLFFVVLLLAPAILISQNPNKEINKIYRSVERGEDVVKIGIPGFLARSAFNVARVIEKQNNKKEAKETGYYDDSEDLTMQELKPFVKAIKGVKVLVVENENEIPTNQVKKSLKKLKSNQIVENLVQVKSDGSDVNIMVAEKKGKIRNLIIMVTEDEELIMLNLKMKMKTDKLNDLIKMFQKKDAVDKIKDNIYA